MSELWKDIGECKGYEEFKGLYEVSNLGRMRSKDRIVNYMNKGTRVVKGKLLKICTYRSGYSYVGLSNAKLQKNILIHRAVALAFLSNPSNYPVVNHKDEDKSNNKVSNLEWCTVKYNTNYGTGIQRMRKNLSKPVAQYDKQGNLLHTYNSITEASRQFQSHYAFTGISKCCIGKLETSYGYVWKFLD